jgi:hypothetical protein
MPSFSGQLRSKHVTIAFALGAVLFLHGCDSSPVKPAPSSSDDPKAFVASDDPKALVASWNDFIRQAKGREHLAAQSWRQQRDGGTRFTVDWIQQDVKETDSLASPVTGYVTLRAHAYLAIGHHFVNEYVLEFTPDAGLWRYRTGTNQRLDSEYADEEPQPYVTLKGEMKVLFSE